MPAEDVPAEETAAPSPMMSRALQLANRGLGATGTNPMVGCVLVDADGTIVGEGFHEWFGGPHAERNALAAADDRDLSAATLYVTLEPCSHHGKTPPCADAVIASGVRKVVAAMQDPNPDVSGRGFDAIRAAGIEVEVGDGATEARRLNAAFLKRLATGRPYVIAKYAMTLDGRVASRTGHSKWISGTESRLLVHQLRGTCDAILTGIGTVQADDPLLTARPPGPAGCSRYIIDPAGQLPPDSQLTRTAAETRTAAFVREGVALNVPHVEAIAIEPGGDGSLPIDAVLTTLADRGVARLFLEAGGRTIGRFFDAAAIDEWHVFIAPKLVGGRDAPGPIGGQGRERVPDRPDLLDAVVERTGDDVYVRGLTPRPWLEANPGD